MFGGPRVNILDAEDGLKDETIIVILEAVVESARKWASDGTIEWHASRPGVKPFQAGAVLTGQASRHSLRAAFVPAMPD